MRLVFGEIAAYSTESVPNNVRQVIQVSQTASTDKSLINTETIEALQDRIELSDLPQPYNTESADKLPNVIAVPSNPILKVPQGLNVNINS